MEDAWKVVSVTGEEDFICNKDGDVNCEWWYETLGLILQRYIELRVQFLDATPPKLSWKTHPKAESHDGCNFSKLSVISSIISMLSTDGCVSECIFAQKSEVIPSLPNKHCPMSLRLLYS